MRKTTGAVNTAEARTAVMHKRRLSASVAALHDGRPPDSQKKPAHT
ncbi:hypothetical protein M7775_10345 [Sporomusa sphaeroides DSM 2875]|nr:hypothetical protein [Sporomusa sphaeroides]MCM0758963.1 hypothetical protein [Sporomusa sphaeroides DSM 2875]